MRKYLVAIISVMVVVSAVVYVVNVIIADRHLKMAAASSQKLLMDVASYIARHEEVFTGLENGEKEEGAGPKALFNAVISLTGVERIVITDTDGVVEAASSELFSPGDDFSGYLIEPLLFQRAVFEKKAVATGLIKISGFYFRSCYMPVIVNSREHVIVVDADRAYFSSVSHIRLNLLITSGLQLLLLLFAVALVLIIAGRYQRSLEALKRQEKLSFLGRAASELAHELKNPLAIIKSSADVLQKQHDPSGSNPVFSFLSSEAMRMSRLIDGMLGFVRDRKLEKEWLLLGNLFAVVRREWETVNVAEPSETLKILANRDAFRQIMGNLIRNAIECGKENPRVEINAGEKGGFLRITVKDNGPGIPEAVRKNIFEPFVSGKKEGIGLGLAIAAGLCEKHSWKIAALKPETGAEFEIIIPEKLWRKS